MDFLFPNIAYGASARFDEFITNFGNDIVNPLIRILFALALMYFLWGLYEFLSNQENEEKKTSGKSHMVYGIIGITIMLGVWTILGIVTNTLNIKKSEIDPEHGKVDLNDYTPPR